MKNLLVTTLAAMAFMFSTAADADVDVKIGASVGSANTTLDDPTIDFDATDFGWKVFGNIMFTDHFGIEASYLDLGAPDDDILGSIVEIDSNAFDAFIVGAIPATDFFDVFAKVGLVSWDTDISVANLPSLSDDGTDLAYGIGAAFNAGNNLSIRAEWEAFDIEDTDGIWMLSVGVSIGF